MEKIDDLYELSPMQQGMLFHALYAPESATYFEQISCTLQGRLNVEAFQRAWRQVVERHPVLRTAFYWEGLDKPLQVVSPDGELSWFQTDWRSHSPEAQQSQLKTLLQADRDQGFELNQAPLMRCALIQIAEDAHYFIWSHHHLLIDGWSLSLALKEVFVFYEAFNQGKALRLPTPRPYRDYILWLQQQDEAQAQAFWRQSLQGLIKPTPPPLASPEGDARNHQGDLGQAQIQLSESVTAALRTLAQRRRLTLNTLVQGAWALLLSRYSGESEVVFGAVVSGRPPTLTGVESMMGLFINTLPVRVSVSEAVELLPWLQQLQTQQVEREQYAYLPLADIQSCSHTPRDVPLFNSILVFENYPVDESLRQRDRSLNISQVQTFARTNYPLTIIAIPSQELTLRMRYDTARFDAASIDQLLRHLATALSAMPSHTEQGLADLPLLSGAERRQQLVEWNHTQTDYGLDTCLHQYIESQVERTPEAIAVVYEDQPLTYRQLNRRANQLAHQLQALGIGPDRLVALYVERSLEMVVGMLAILKAGGAYAPLDPTWPKARVEAMLADAHPQVLLTQSSLLDHLPDYAGEILCLDRDRSAIAQMSDQNPASSVAPTHLAYVIYTSGSTGEPKGVAIEHRSIVNYVHAITAQIDIEVGDQLALVSTVAADLGNTVLFPALCQGGCLHVLSLERSTDPEALAAYFQACQIDILKIVPSHLAALQSAAQPERLMPRKCLIVGGEASRYEWIEQLQQQRPSCRILNHYGPTETAVGVLTHAVDIKAGGDKTTILPLGKPLPNTQIYILDRQLRPLPIGAPGELHIGGVGLARGYLNRPKLTAEKFIPIPFQNPKSKIQNPKSNRLYKTGDLAQYLPDGSIAFLGRIDRQVKIRGFRIELGEIESALLHHPQVQTAVVIDYSAPSGERQLAAYIVTQPQVELAAKELRQFLRRRLPEYMTPSAFMQIAEPPLTVNGKIDYQALPAPDVSARMLETEFVPPRNETETLLANIVTDVLGLKNVGVHDSFFELGGHSLRATQAISRIREAFAVDLSLRSLFEHPTVAELAEIIISKQLEQADNDLLEQILAEVDDLPDLETPKQMIQHY